MENPEWKMYNIYLGHMTPVNIFSNLLELRDEEEKTLADFDEKKINHPKWLYYVLNLAEGSNSSFLIGQPLGMLSLSEIKTIAHNMDRHLIIKLAHSKTSEKKSITFELKDNPKSAGIALSNFTLFPNCPAGPQGPKGAEESDKKETENEEITKEDIEAVTSSHKFNFWEAFILGSLLGSAIKNDMEKNEKEEKKKEDSSDESL